MLKNQKSYNPDEEYAFYNVNHHTSDELTDSISISDYKNYSHHYYANSVDGPITLIDIYYEYYNN